MSHLTEKALAVSVLPLKERMAYMNTMWIGYTQATNIIEGLEELIEHPPSHRMPGILIVGAGNNGKSHILNHFRKRNKAYVSKEDDLVKLPIVYVQMPATPSEKDFYLEILDAVHAPYKISDRPDRRMQLVITALRSLHVKILMIDEFHHILAGNSTKQRQMLNMLKVLSNKLGISLVGAGTKEAFRAIQTDPQLASRFTPYVLSKWKMDEDDEYLSLLASFERLLPLQKPSDLTDEKIALKILTMTDRTIGQISGLLKACAKYAINTGTECITLKTLNEVKWKTPADIDKEQRMEI
jgi:hypothetical protein